MRCKVITHSPEETMEIGRKIGSGLAAGSILTLEGDLAAGKTTFTKGLALGLGVEDVIDSPTFAIVKEYEGWLPLFHMDVYRLDGDSDTEFIVEYFERDGVCVIEWASMIAADLPNERVDVKINRLDGACREITVVDQGGGLLNVNFSD
ncbi:MAG: tRNA (adenosine(37)-N6)-threonylcarbamoyltransferase complex ATPase subunit type 1 TsaE [Defluviitaleaceae bacterium]|nr:tRNA (adenosine(37)-N6)-threonylcarbamoyltransferase complex ATPase subunit type 1 TsaE [Defluviitaleaceae bacterium]